MGVGCAHRACEEEIRGLNEDLTTALNHLVQHKLHIQETLQQLEETARATMRSVNEMPVPR
jgi:hypothetical protein